MPKKGAKKGVKKEAEVSSKDIQKEIQRHMGGGGKQHSLWHDINKLVTVVLILSVLVYGALLFFAYTSVEDKGFFSFEVGKRFYAFTSCDLDRKIHCQYHTRVHNVTTLHLENDYPFPIKIYSARTRHCVMMKNITVRGAQDFNLTMNCTSYNPPKSDIKIHYVNLESTLHHHTRGKILSYLEVTAIFQVLHDINGFFSENVDFVESSVDEVK